MAEIFLPGYGLGDYSAFSSATEIYGIEDNAGLGIWFHGAAQFIRHRWRGFATANDAPGNASFDTAWLTP
jgi:hypothetical protein